MLVTLVINESRGSDRSPVGISGFRRLSNQRQLPTSFRQPGAARQRRLRADLTVPSDEVFSIRLKSAPVSGRGSPLPAQSGLVGTDPKTTQARRNDTNPII